MTIVETTDMHPTNDRVPQTAASRNHASAADATALPEPLQAIADALAQIRYGVIQLTVHDGRLMQLDITERRRFT